MTIYHYIGYYIGSLIIFLRNSKSDVASATLRERPPYDPATFLQDLEEAGVILINN